MIWAAYAHGLRTPSRKNMHDAKPRHANCCCPEEPPSPTFGQWIRARVGVPREDAAEGSRRARHAARLAPARAGGGTGPSHGGDRRRATRHRPCRRVGGGKDPSGPRGPGPGRSCRIRNRIQRGSSRVTSSGRSWSPSAPISAASRSRIRVLMMVTSARAMARSMTHRDASGRGPRR